MGEGEGSGFARRPGLSWDCLARRCFLALCFRVDIARLSLLPPVSSSTFLLKAGDAAGDSRAGWPPTCYPGSPIPSQVLYFLLAEMPVSTEDLMASLLIKGGRVLSPEDNLDGVLDVRIEDGGDSRDRPEP